MFDAQLIKSTGANFNVYGPWMQREGDNAVFTIEAVAASVTGLLAKFRVTLETKAGEDAGDGTAIDTGQFLLEIDTTETKAAVVTGQMKELVRYKFEFNGSSEVGNWVLFRMLPPSWFDTVKA